MQNREFILTNTLDIHKGFLCFVMSTNSSQHRLAHFAISLTHLRPPSLPLFLNQYMRRHWQEQRPEHI